MPRRPVIFGLTVGLALFLTALALVLRSWTATQLDLPSPFGVCVGYGLGTRDQLDALGQVWYTDYSYQDPGLGNHPRLYMVKSYALNPEVFQAMRGHPGAWWILGNEPNDPAQDNLSPAQYAALYADFYRQARQADPTAHLLPAGIANADWHWAQAFREEYHRLTGGYPVVDGWNIHNYILDQEHDPYDSAEFKRRIVSFRQWQAGIGDGPKPLFLTEFGVLYGAGCCERPLDPPEKGAVFMVETITWLAETDYVQYWAWFAVRSGDATFNGDLFDAAGQPTLFGRTYQAVIRRWGTATWR